MKMVISFLMNMCCVDGNVNCCDEGVNLLIKVAIVDESGNGFFDENVNC